MYKQQSFFLHNYEKLHSSGLNNDPSQPTTHQLFFMVISPPPTGVNLQMSDTTFQHSNYWSTNCSYKYTLIHCRSHIYTHTQGSSVMCQRGAGGKKQHTIFDQRSVRGHSFKGSDSIHPDRYMFHSISVLWYV